MFKKNSAKKKLFGKLPFQLVALLVLVVIFSLGSAFSRELYREYKIKKEIDTLKTEIESMEKDNYELSQLLEYYQTDEYREAEARKRLNLKEEGEQVVMIDEKVLSAEDMAIKEEEQKNSVSNYIKWWNYFFASQS
ncbi:MAG: septum formation initiator family protein [Candidatus Paceibacterota bacterium]